MPTVHYARHHLLAHMSVGAGLMPRGHRPAPQGHTAKKAEVNKCMCVCVCVCVRMGELGGRCASVHFLTED